MSLKLYELSESINQVAYMMEEGVEGLEGVLETVELSFSEKVESIAKLIRSKAAERDAIDEERQRLAARAQKLDKDAQWLMDYVEREMINSGIHEVKSALFKIKMSKTPPRVEVLNQNIIPDQYMRTTISVTPDKTAIKDVLKQGRKIPGVELRQDLRLSLK